ncbi:MAG TPA: LanC-like protein [Rhizomicrobium sp.]|nr:LanC-like protein [Rhizomicrobium sp.]
MDRPNNASWDENAARSVVQAIASDVYSHFDDEQFWPAHPLDDWVEEGDTTLYWGATGNMVALEHLAREGAIERQRDFAGLLPGLLKRNRAAFLAKAPMAGMDSSRASLLIGDIGPLLLAMRVAPATDIADALHTRISANLAAPPAELMWGVPGTMLACLFLYDMTNEPRWGALYRAQAAKLLSDLEETESGPMWTQALYGRRFRFLGFVHGFAGNMLALLRGWDSLDEAQRTKIREVLARTLPGNAICGQSGANWRADAFGPMEARLVQICHGAPGMIVGCADARALTPELRALLCDGGECTWQMGPLAKGSNLCHGTAGNGYAFLKLFALTRDQLWLSRARSFASLAIEQWREAQTRYDHGRYSLWTGDPGLAIFLWDCVTAVARFPSIDCF